tara:strand:+ start:167 stop:364 length:198 start_codon:yes stop_codon:yes gene_type:complete
MNKRDGKYYFDIIDQIEEIRSKNNNNWMDILRLAFLHTPSEAGKIMEKIYSTDEEMSKLAKKLSS